MSEMYELSEDDTNCPICMHEFSDEPLVIPPVPPATQPTILKIFPMIFCPNKHIICASCLWAMYVQPDMLFCCPYCKHEIKDTKRCKIFIKVSEEVKPNQSDTSTNYKSIIQKNQQNILISQINLDESQVYPYVKPQRIQLAKPFNEKIKSSSMKIESHQPSLLVNKNKIVSQYYPQSYGNQPALHIVSYVKPEQSSILKDQSSNQRKVSNNLNNQNQQVGPNSVPARVNFQYTSASASKKEYKM